MAAFQEPGTGTGTATADEHGAVYFPYFEMHMMFDDARARAVLGTAGIRAPRVADYFPTLMRYAELARWGKRDVVREDAAAVPTLEAA